MRDITCRSAICPLSVSIRAAPSGENGENCSATSLDAFGVTGVSGQIANAVVRGKGRALTETTTAAVIAYSLAGRVADQMRALVLIPTEKNGLIRSPEGPPLGRGPRLQKGL